MRQSASPASDATRNDALATKCAVSAVRREGADISRERDAQRLRFTGSLAALTDARAFAAHLAPARQTAWVVCATRPLGGPHQVLDDVGRYTHRVAISNERLLTIDDGHVTFRYTDYRANGADRQTTMTLEARAFIRRFLLHVLPRGFHRIRYDGLFGNRHRAARVAQCRRLLRMPASPAPRIPPAAGSPLANPLRPRCPICREGHMIAIDEVPQDRGVTRLDTS